MAAKSLPEQNSKISCKVVNLVLKTVKQGRIAMETRETTKIQQN